MTNRSESDPGGASWHSTHGTVEGTQGLFMGFSKCLHQIQQDLSCVNHEWPCARVLVEKWEGKVDVYRVPELCWYNRLNRNKVQQVLFVLVEK